MTGKVQIALWEAQEASADFSPAPTQVGAVPPTRLESFWFKAKGVDNHDD